LTSLNPTQYLCTNFNSNWEFIETKVVVSYSEILKYVIPYKYVCVNLKWVKKALLVQLIDFNRLHLIYNTFSCK